MANSYDLVVIGTGTAASVAAHRCREAGWRVAVIDHLPFGGTCALRGCDPKKILVGAAQAVVVQATSNGQEQSIPADVVVHAAGRVPDLDPLDLPAAGVETERGRLKLNEHLQSKTNPAVYAAGDAAGKGPPLTPVAARDGRMVAANMLAGNHQKPNYRGIPSVAFTIPPIASVGLSEKQARDQRIKFRVQKENAHDWYTARSIGESAYGFKVLVESDTDRILGAHLVGPYADEVINVFAMAIRNDLTTRELEDTVFSYPTAVSDVHYML
jgi:glutathione reductase (NADPH)